MKNSNSDKEKQLLQLIGSPREFRCTQRLLNSRYPHSFQCGLQAVEGLLLTIRLQDAEGLWQSLGILKQYSLSIVITM